MTADFPGMDESVAEEIQRKTQLINELKLKRMTAYNEQLKEKLAQEHIHASTANLSLIHYTKETPDLLIPSIWGQIPSTENPYLPKNSRSNMSEAGCCVIM